MSSPPKPIASPPKPRKPRTPSGLSPQQWAEIEQSWAEGRFATLREMCEFYKAPPKAVEERLKAKKIRKGQAIEEYNRKVQEELEKKAEKAAKLLAERIEETREQHYTMASGIAKLTWAEILKAKQDGHQLSVVRQNIASLEGAMKVLKMAREERFAVLGIDKEGSNLDEDDVPELTVSELSQNQIDEMRARDEAALIADGDDEVVVLTDEVPLGDIDPDLDDDAEAEE